MKKFLLVWSFLMAIAFCGNAQFWKIPKWDYYWDLKAHEKGQIHFNYGYGQPRMDYKLFNHQKDSTDFRSVGVGPFYWRMEYGLSRKLSVAVSASWILYKSDWKRQRPDGKWGIDLPYIYGTRCHDIAANLRFNYHFFVNKEWDLYIGGGAGYNYFMRKYFTNYGPDDSTFDAHFKIPYPISYEMSVGARYYFLTRTAIYLEAGFGKSLIQGGFTFKFRYRKRG
jgi:hypothetical protein